MRRVGWLVVAALLAQAAAGAEPAVVEQKRPLIYTTPQDSDVARGDDAETSIDFEVVKTHTAGWKRLLVNLGFAHPFFQVKLSVANGGDEAPVEQARWEFPTEYYFPDDAGDIVGTEVLVNVWRSFPVTAHVSFADGSEKTIRKWIEPKQFPQN